MTIATTTAPNALPPLDTASIQARLEAIEANVVNLQANRQPQAFHLRDLTDCNPLSNVVDESVPTWSKLQGLWVPSTPLVGDQVAGTLVATNSSFTDLGGPRVTAKATERGIALVTLNAFIQPSVHATVGESAFMGVSINGDSPSTGVRAFAKFSDFSGTGCGASCNCLQAIFSLTPGTSYTFVAEYRTSSTSGFSSSFTFSIINVQMI